MAIFKSCCCCSLYLGGLMCGFYSIVTYLAVFVVEVWWIIYKQGHLPIPEFILMGGYFIVFLASLFMLSGVAAKKTSFLLLWLVVMITFFSPECGIVLYLFIKSLEHYKHDPRELGMLIFYICRAVINVFCIMVIHSLYSKWREDKKILQRLDNLTLVYPPPSRIDRHATSHKYEIHDNAGFTDYDKRQMYEYNKYRASSNLEMNKGYPPRISHVRQPDHSHEMIENKPQWQNHGHHKHQKNNWPDKKWESMGAIHLDYLENNYYEPYEKRTWNENRYNNLHNESYEDSREFQCYVPRSLRNLNEADLYIGQRPASICTPRILYENNYKTPIPQHPSSGGLQRKSKSVDALTKLEFDDAVTLEPLQWKPFDYLHRSGMLPTDFEDSKNIKDIAL